MNANDERPPVAIGHVSIEVSDIAAATDAFVGLGMRQVHRGGSIAILELRGGTHLVVRRAEGAIENGRPAPFDLMVDDVEAARAGYVERGMAATEIDRGRIHDSFVVTGPDGYRISITSSHAGGRPV